MKKILSILAAAMLLTFGVGCVGAKECSELKAENCTDKDSWPKNKKCKLDTADAKKCVEDTTK